MTIHNDKNPKIVELERKLEKAEATRDYWHGEFERVGNQYEATLEKLEKAEADLKLNVSMLAKQTDMARETEIKFAILKRAVVRQRAGLYLPGDDDILR